MSRQRGGSHLPAGHAEVGIIYKNHCNVLVADRRVHGLGETDGQRIAVPLVGEHRPVRPAALDGRRHRRRPSVLGLYPVNSKGVDHQAGAANGHGPDGLIRHPQLFQHLRHQAVDYAVSAAGAVFIIIDQCLWFCFNHCPYTPPSFLRPQSWRPHPEYPLSQIPPCRL